MASTKMEGGQPGPIHFADDTVRLENPNDILNEITDKPVSILAIPEVEASEITSEVDGKSEGMSISAIPEVEACEITSEVDGKSEGMSILPIPEVEASEITSEVDGKSEGTSILPIPEVEASEITSEVDGKSEGTSVLPIPEVEASEITSEVAGKSEGTSVLPIPEVKASEITSEVDGKTEGTAQQEEESLSLPASDQVQVVPTEVEKTQDQMEVMGFKVEENVDYTNSEEEIPQTTEITNENNTEETEENVNQTTQLESGNQITIEADVHVGKNKEEMINFEKDKDAAPVEKPKPNVQLVVTSVGLVRKNLIEDQVGGIETEPEVAIENIENSQTNYNEDRTSPVPGNEILSAKIKVEDEESIKDERVDDKQTNSDSMVIENADESVQKSEEKPEKLFVSPVRKSVRPAKKKVKRDYEEIASSIATELPPKKKAKTFSDVMEFKNAQGKEEIKNKRKPRGKAKAVLIKNKLDVDDVYSGEDDEDIQEQRTESITKDIIKLHMLKCEVCDKHFMNRKSLTQHKRKVHKSKKRAEKDYPCDVCGYVFKRQEHWRRHREVHAKARPHTCPICNKAFKRLEHVKRHQSVHSTVKPYPCDYCEKAFTRPDHLAKHTLLHTDPVRAAAARTAKREKKSGAKPKRSKMIKTVPRGRGKVTVQLRPKVNVKKQDEDFEYGDIPDEELDGDAVEEEDQLTDVDDYLSTDEEEGPPTMVHPKSGKVKLVKIY